MLEQQYKIVDFDEKYLGKEGVVILHDDEELEYITHRRCDQGLEAVLWTESAGFMFVVETRNVLAIHFNDLKIKVPIELIPFCIKKYNTGDYFVCTWSGELVDSFMWSIPLLNNGHEYPIVCVVPHHGWGIFNVKGKKYGTDQRLNVYDIFLMEKSKWIN